MSGANRHDPSTYSPDWPSLALDLVGRRVKSFNTARLLFELVFCGPLGSTVLLVPHS
jgi:hypothetical protein